MNSAGELPSHFPGVDGLIPEPDAGTFVRGAFNAVLHSLGQASTVVISIKQNELRARAITKNHHHHSPFGGKNICGVESPSLRYQTNGNPGSCWNGKASRPKLFSLHLSCLHAPILWLALSLKIDFIIVLISLIHLFVCSQRLSCTLSTPRRSWVVPWFQGPMG